MQLRTYSGESLTLVGETDVKARYGQQVAFLKLIVVKGKGPNLFGRNWMQNLKLKWKEIFHLHITGRTSHEEGFNIRSLSPNTRKYSRRRWDYWREQQHR